MPELVALICEQLETDDISDFRAACRTTESNSRNFFATKAFQTVCVAYTEPGLKRLQDIAQCHRLSWALKSMVLYHADFVFNIDSMEACERGYSPNRAFYKQKWIPFKKFVSVQRRFFALRTDFACLKRTFVALKEHGTALSIVVMGVQCRDVQSTLDDGEISNRYVQTHGYDIERVTNLLGGIGNDFVCLDDAVTDADFDKVFDNLEFALECSGLGHAVEQFGMPNYMLRSRTVTMGTGSVHMQGRFMANVHTLDIGLFPEYVCNKHDFEQTDNMLSLLSRLEKVRNLTLRLDTDLFPVKRYYSKYLSGLLRETVLDSLQTLDLIGEWVVQKSADMSKFFSNHSSSLVKLSMTKFGTIKGCPAEVFRAIASCDALQSIRVGSWNDSKQIWYAMEFLAEVAFTPAGADRKYISHITLEDDCETFCIEQPAIKHCMQRFARVCEEEQEENDDSEDEEDDVTEDEEDEEDEEDGEHGHGGPQEREEE